MLRALLGLFMIFFLVQETGLAAGVSQKKRSSQSQGSGGVRQSQPRTQARPVRRTIVRTPQSNNAYRAHMARNTRTKKIFSSQPQALPPNQIIQTQPLSEPKIQQPVPQPPLQPQIRTIQRNVLTSSSSHAPSGVLTSGSRSSSGVLTSSQYSQNVSLPPRIAPRRTASSGNSPMTKEDFIFIHNLSSRVNTQKASRRLRSIGASQEKGGLLSKDDYVFLMDLARKVTNDQAANMLYSIAQKRRQASY